MPILLLLYPEAPPEQLTSISLAIMAFTGTVTHVVTGAFAHGVNLTLSLAQERSCSAAGLTSPTGLVERGSYADWR